MQSGLQAGQWPGKTADPVSYHRITKRGMVCVVTVAVDANAVHLRGQSCQYLTDQGLAPPRLQALVHPAQPHPLTASQNQARYQWLAVYCDRIDCFSLFFRRVLHRGFLHQNDEPLQSRVRAEG